MHMTVQLDPTACQWGCLYHCRAW